MSTAKGMDTRKKADAAGVNVPRAQLILEHAEELKFPEVVVGGILEMLESSTVTTKAIAARAIKSPEISAFVLRVAAAAPDSTSANSLESAIEQVGRREIGRLLTSRPTYRLTAGPMPFYGMTFASYLRHAGEVADMSERAARALGVSELVERAALAGALHDLGKVVLASVASSQILSGREAPHDERDAFGVDHARVGAWLGQHWGFPADICRAISQHHAMNPPDGMLERSVWLGNLLVRASEGDDATLRIAQGGFDASGLSQTAFEQLIVGGGPQEGPRRAPGLTDREIQILRLLAEGETAKQVAHPARLCSLDGSQPPAPRLPQARCQRAGSGLARRSGEQLGLRQGGSAFVDRNAA